MHLWTKRCWVWWGRAKRYNKYTRTTADWLERSWVTSWSGLFSLSSIQYFSSLLCLELSLPAVFLKRSQANKKGRTRTHTHRYIHSHTHAHTTLHNVHSFPLLTLEDILARPFSALILMSSSYSVTHTHTHTCWDIWGQRAWHVPQFWKNTFEIG